jgi:hypothetical protein
MVALIPTLESLACGVAIAAERKITVSELSKAWRDIYATFEDNAFDYVGKPFYNDNDGTIQLWDGSKMVTYAEVPF